MHQRPTDAEPLTGSTGSPSNTKPRVAGWRTVGALAQQHDDIPGGVRLRFARDVDVPAIAALADAQQDYYRFITFNLGIRPDAVTLDITGPDDARAVIDAFVQAGMNDQRALISQGFATESCEPAGCAPPSNGSVEADHDPIAAGLTVSTRRSVT